MARQNAEDIFGVAFDYGEFEQYGEDGDEVSEAEEDDYESGLTTNLLSFSLNFVKKIIDLPGGQIDDHSLRRIFFSTIPSSNFLSSVLDPSRSL